MGAFLIIDFYFLDVIIIIMKYSFEALPCVSDQTGNTVRPYAINGKVIYNMSLQSLFEDEIHGRKTEVEKLANAVSKEIGVNINPENLVKYLTDKKIIVADKDVN